MVASITSAFSPESCTIQYIGLGSWIQFDRSCLTCTKKGHEWASGKHPTVFNISLMLFAECVE